jgi:hypothetical protein
MIITILTYVGIYLGIGAIYMLSFSGDNIKESTCLEDFVVVSLIYLLFWIFILISGVLDFLSVVFNSKRIFDSNKNTRDLGGSDDLLKILD